MLKQVIYLLTLFTFLSTSSQSKKKKDKQSIMEMCGCFEVSFNFAETFRANDNDNYISSNNYSTGGLEWAKLVKDH